jgi:hypothetical protein
MRSYLAQCAPEPTKLEAPQTCARFLVLLVADRATEPPRAMSLCVRRAFSAAPPLGLGTAEYWAQSELQSSLHLFCRGAAWCGRAGGSCVPLGFRLSCSGESRGAVVQRWGGPAGHGKPGPYQPVYAGCPAMEGSRARQHAGFAPGLVFSLPQSFLSQAPPEGASQKCIRGDYDEPSHLFAASPQHKGARLLCVRSLKGLWAPGS